MAQTILTINETDNEVQITSEPETMQTTDLAAVILFAINALKENGYTDENIDTLLNKIKEM